MANTRACLDREISERIDSVHARISAGHLELLRDIAELDRRESWRSDGCRDMAQWVSGRLGISNWAARRWVHAGHALENLPLISQALERGSLCLDKVLELTRFATADTEAKLIDWARRVSVAAVRRRADRAARPSLDEAQDVERARFVRWWWFDDGRRLGLEGEFPAAQGTAITKAIKRIANQLPELPPDEPSSELESSEERMNQRCADALFALASQSISRDADADRATVVVHTTLGAIREERSSEIEGGPVINARVAERLSCDARLQFVLTDREGNALGIGTTSRDVPAWLMRELRFRDQGCTFPGCGTTAFLQAHHIWHWEHGGPTELDNLVLVCHFHHKLLHEFAWNVRLKGSLVEWFRPNGRGYDPGPDPPEQSTTDGSNDLSLETNDSRLAAAS